ncbi:hypothetical protein ACFQ78_19710 [Streptomyces sp. NPDC056519]|uniref:hypothetical protein n=1 Tax=Streptomyces sp. NPDC056519 TaxID=3345849 RepID=UPI0036CC1393
MPDMLHDAGWDPCFTWQNYRALEGLTTETMGMGGDTAEPIVNAFRFYCHAYLTFLNNAPADALVEDRLFFGPLTGWTETDPRSFSVAQAMRASEDEFEGLYRLFVQAFHSRLAGTVPLSEVSGLPDSYDIPPILHVPAWDERFTVENHRLLSSLGLDGMASGTLDQTMGTSGPQITLAFRYYCREYFKDNAGGNGLDSRTEEAIFFDPLTGSPLPIAQSIGVTDDYFKGLYTLFCDAFDRRAHALSRGRHGGVEAVTRSHTEREASEQPDKHAERERKEREAASRAEAAQRAKEDRAAKQQALEAERERMRATEEQTRAAKEQALKAEQERVWAAEEQARADAEAKRLQEEKERWLQEEAQRTRHNGRNAAEAAAQRARERAEAQARRAVEAAEARAAEEARRAQEAAVAEGRDQRRAEREKRQRRQVALHEDAVSEEQATRTALEDLRKASAGAPADSRTRKRLHAARKAHKSALDTLALLESEGQVRTLRREIRRLRDQGLSNDERFAQCLADLRAKSHDVRRLKSELGHVPIMEPAKPVRPRMGLRDRALKLYKEIHQNHETVDSAIAAVLATHDVPTGSAVAELISKDIKAHVEKRRRAKQ